MRIQGRVRQVRELLLEAHRRQRSDLDGPPAFVSVTPGGEISQTTINGPAYLDRPGFRSRLLRAVATAEQDRKPERRFLHRGLEIELRRMGGEGGRAFLARICPVEQCLLPLEALLTPSQRDVAQLVRSGATENDMAKALGRRPGTVHSQLRDLYERLGVSSRVELVRLLDEDPQRKPHPPMWGGIPR